MIRSLRTNFGRLGLTTKAGNFLTVLIWILAMISGSADVHEWGPSTNVRSVLNIVLKGTFVLWMLLVALRTYYEGAFRRERLLLPRLSAFIWALRQFGIYLLLTTIWIWAFSRINQWLRDSEGLGINGFLAFSSLIGFGLAGLFLFGWIGYRDELTILRIIEKSEDPHTLSSRSK